MSRTTSHFSLDSDLRPVWNLLQGLSHHKQTLHDIFKNALMQWSPVTRGSQLKPQSFFLRAVIALRYHTYRSSTTARGIAKCCNVTADCVSSALDSASAGSRAECRKESGYRLNLESRHARAERECLLQAVRCCREATEGSQPRE